MGVSASGQKSPKYFESEIGACVGRRGPDLGRVFNACMLDSASSLPIQVVDLILGGIRYAFLLDREPAVPRDANKETISRAIRGYLGAPKWEFAP